jgi:hypothetical protein
MPIEVNEEKNIQKNLQIRPFFLDRKIFTKIAEILM